MILLIGNFLSKHGLNPTAIEDLASVLSSQYKIKKSSNKKISIIRLFDMALSVILNRKKCKLIIVDVFSTRALLFSCLVILLAKWYKIPHVPVLRGGNLPERFKRYSVFFNFLFSDSKIIISPSKYLQESIKKINYPIKVIPNYIDIDKYTYKSRKHIKPNLFWVRSIHNIYNPIMAVYVLYQLKKIYPNASLCMVGPIKDFKVMQKLNNKINSLNLKSSVSFTGHLPKEQWIELSCNYDIFINTTNYDNTPVTIIEAMALGLPIVSTNVGGMPKLIKHDYNGKLVNANDTLGMIECIRQYVEDEKQLLYICNNARMDVDNNYSKINVVPKWFRLINDII